MRIYIILFLIITICLITLIANAAPFLVCDVDPIVTSYIVTLDNGEELEVPAPLHVDCSTITEGAHVYTVKAKNIWGESKSVPFEFTKALPVLPTNISLESK